MNIKKIVYVGMMLLCLCLSACKPIVRVDLYLSDIIAVAGTKKIIMTNVVLGIPIPSADRCEEYSNTLTEILTPYTKDLVFKECSKISGEMHDLAIYTMNIPVADWETESAFTGLLGISVESEDYSKGERLPEVSIKISDKLKNVVAQANSKFISSADVKEADIIITLVDDEKESRYVVLESCYVSGEPVDRAGKILMSNRDKISIVLSNVKQDLLFKYLGGTIFSYAAPDSHFLGGVGDIF